MKNNMITERGGLLYFNETTKLYTTLNKIINKYTYKFKLSEEFELEEVNQIVVSSILEFCDERGLDIENLTESILKQISFHLKISVHYLINVDSYSIVLKVNGKLERVYLQKLKSLGSSGNTELSSINNLEQTSASIFNSGKIYYPNLNIEDEKAFLDKSCKERVNTFFNNYITKTNEEMIAVYGQEELKSMIKYVAKVLSKNKTMTLRYVHLLKQKEMIEAVLENEAVDEVMIDKLLENIDEIVYETVDLNHSNYSLIINNLYKFIEHVENFDEKYMDKPIKSYNVLTEIRRIKEHHPDVKLFYVNEGGIIENYKKK